MNSIITDNSNDEHAISSKIDNFFAKYSISKLMKKSNFYKEGGIQYVVVLKEIFGLVFSGKNLFRTLKMNPDNLSFKKKHRMQIPELQHFQLGKVTVATGYAYN